MKILRRVRIIAESKELLKIQDNYLNLESEKETLVDLLKELNKTKKDVKSKSKFYASEINSFQSKLSTDFINKCQKFISDSKKSMSKLEKFEKDDITETYLKPVEDWKKQIPSVIEI